MNTLLSFFLIFFLTSNICISYSSANVSFAQDSTEKVVPTYKNVDVVIETDWAEPDKSENVDVIIKSGDKKTTGLIIIYRDFQRCEITLIPGIVVRIYAHKTGKLIKTLKVN